MFGTFVVAMAIFISYAESTPRASYIDFFTSMSGGPVIDSHNDPALAGIDNSSTPVPQEVVSTTLFPEHFPTYSPDASKSMQPHRQRDRNAAGSMSEHPRESLSATEGKGQFSLMDMNTWDSIPTAFFEPVAPSVTRGNKSGASNLGVSWQNPITFSEAGAEPSLSWDYSSVGMGGGADIGGGGTQDVALPLADHSPGSMQADQPFMGIDWSAPPVSKDTAKYREEPTPKPATVRFSDGESMAKAILSGQVKKWEWTYSTTLGVGSSSGHGDRYDKSVTCCQRLPYICGVDGMCVIGIDECQEFCTCAANPHMPHCQKIIPRIKRTMAALEKKILAKVARDLTFTTTTTSTTTTRAQIYRKPAAGDFIPRITHSGQFIIHGEESAARATQTLNPAESRTAAEATRKPAAATRFQPSAVPKDRDSVVHFQNTQSVQNTRNLSQQNSQKQPSVNTKTTIPAGAISDSKTSQRNQNVLAATLDRRYHQVTVTPSPKSVKTLLNPSPENLKATQFHPASLSKNGLASRGSTIPTQAPTISMRKPQTQTHAPTTGIRKPQTQTPTNGMRNPQTQTTAELKPKPSPRNSKLPFTVDPDAVPTTKTTLLSPGSINASSKARTNSSPSGGLAGNLKQNRINNSNSTPSVTYTVRNKGVRTNGTGVNTHTVGLKDSKIDTTDTKSDMQAKEKKHTSLGDTLVTTTLNKTRQRMETGRLNNITRTSNADRDITTTRNGSGTTPWNSDINTGEWQSITSRHHVSTSRPGIMITMITNKAPGANGAVPIAPRKISDDNISSTFTRRITSGSIRNTAASFSKASVPNSNRDKPAISNMHVDGNESIGSEFIGKDSTGNDSVKSASREAISSTLSSRMASVRPSTTTANIEKASIPKSDSDRPAISRLHVDGYDSTGNISTANESIDNDSVKSASKEAISSTLSSRMASVRPNTTTANTEKASIPKTDSDRPAISRMHIDGYDSTGNIFTANESIDNDSVKSASKEAISSTLSSRMASVRPSTTTANIEKASIPKSDSDRPAISRLHVDGYDSTGNISTANESIDNDSVKSASKEAISSTLSSRMASVRPNTTTANTEKASIPKTDSDRPAISRMHIDGYDSTGNIFTANESIDNDSVKSASKEAISSTLSSRMASVRPSTTTANIEKASIPKSDSDRPAMSRLHIDGYDSTGNISTANESIDNDSVKSASKEAISSTLSSRMASVRPSTSTANIEKASIPKSDSDRPAISRLHIDGYDSTGNISTANESIDNDSVKSASKEAISSTLSSRIASVRMSTTTASVEKASISVSSRDIPAISGMHVTDKDSTGNDSTGNDSTSNDSVKSASNKAIISTFISKITGVRTSTAADSIMKKTTLSVNNHDRLPISRMRLVGKDSTGNDSTGNDSTGNDSTGNDSTGNGTVKSASYKQLLGSTRNTKSGNQMTTVGNKSFKLSTMPTAKISNISQEAIELARPNNDGIATFLSFLGNALQYNEPLSSTGREFELTTSSGPKTMVSNSSILAENTTQMNIGSTSVTEQNASGFIQQFTTNSPVTYGDAAVSSLHTLNGTTDKSTPKTIAIEEIQRVANYLSTHEPPQNSSTDYPHTRINDEDEEFMKYTDSSTNNYTSRKPNDTNKLLATDKGSLENNLTGGALNDKETILKNNINRLTHKATTQMPNNTLDNGDASNTGVFLLGTTELPTKDKVHNDSGRSNINVTDTSLNGSILEYYPSMTTTSSDDSEIITCSARCQGDSGVCVLGDDLKSHCMVVSEVCDQHLCGNGYCVSSDGIPACECHRGWFGASCDTPCPVDCNDRSFCEGVGENDIITCACRWNYTGHDCSSTRKVVQRTPDVVFPSGDLETWEVAIVAAVTAVVAALLCVVSPYLLWKNQWLPMRQLCFFFLPYEDEDEKDFDVFISYQASPRDERFVTQHLTPRLEKEFDLRLCLPTRDFVPGESASSNTIRAVKSSRRTVLILSPTYVSEWSKDEYFKVKQEILTLKHKVIPIVLEDFSDLQDADPFFRSFVDSAYSIKWPGDGISRSSSSISKFWKLLELSMPKKRNKSNGSVSSSGLYSSDVAFSSCSKTRFSSNNSSIYDEIIYSPTIVGQNKGSDDGNSVQKTMQTRKPIYSLIANNSFPDLSWYHQGRLSAGSLPSPQESRSISSLSDDTGIEINTRSSSISSGVRICPNIAVNIQERIPRVHSVLGPVPREKF